MLRQSTHYSPCSRDVPFIATCLVPVRCSHSAPLLPFGTATPCRTHPPLPLGPVRRFPRPCAPASPLVSIRPPLPSVTQVSPLVGLGAFSAPDPGDDPSDLDRKLSISLDTGDPEGSAQRMRTPRCLVAGMPLVPYGTAGLRLQKQFTYDTSSECSDGWERLRDCERPQAMDRCKRCDEIETYKRRHGMGP